jgi:hypothetical protein
MFDTQGRARNCHFGTLVTYMVLVGIKIDAGADVPTVQFTSLTIEHGMDTYVIGGLEDPEALRWFASDIVPAVREAVARAR